jgi:hypothetical protein
MTLYKLVNPLIKGKLNTSFEGKNENVAAQKAYNALSKYFHNSTPEFLFTIQKVKNSKSTIGEGKINDYFHFKVLEDRTGNDVSFEIIKYNKINNPRLNKFRKSLQNSLKENQIGGSRFDLDLDDDDYFYRSDTRYSYQPIGLWLYDPYIYTIDRLYVPTFVTSVSPYVTYFLYDYPYLQ